MSPYDKIADRFIQADKELDKLPIRRPTVKYHPPGERVRVLGQFVDEQESLNWAEEAVRRQFPADMCLVDRDAAWRKRKDPPTAQQLLWCQRMGVNVPDGVTKADVQIILSRAFAERDQHQ